MWENRGLCVSRHKFLYSRIGKLQFLSSREPLMHLQIYKMKSDPGVSNSHYVSRTHEEASHPKTPLLRVLVRGLGQSSLSFIRNMVFTKESARSLSMELKLCASYSSQMELHFSRAYFYLYVSLWRFKIVGVIFSVHCIKATHLDLKPHCQSWQAI